MKLRNIFFAIVSGLLLFTGCQIEEPSSLENISLDKTYLSIPAAGGDAVVTVTATDSWVLNKSVVTGTYKDENGKTQNIYDQLPAWLTASVVSGGAGETKVTFHADASEAGREQEIQIACGTQIQYLIVRQGSFDVAEAKIEEALKAPDGKSFKLTGTIVEWYQNAERYGNYYIEDETGRILIYGTADKDGKFQNYPVASWGLELGDVVTIEGPRGNYQGSPQMVNVVITELVKSLLKIDGASSFNTSKNGEEIIVRAAYKGNGVFVNVPVDWVVLSNMDYVPGVPTKLEPNPADTAVITFTVLPNDAEERSAAIELVSAKGESSSSQTVTVAQAAGFSSMPLPYEETFMGGIGSWVATDVVPVEGVASIWAYDSRYGMVAKATKAVDSQAELISPNIDLSGVSSAVLTFKHVQKFAGNVWEELKLFVSTDDGATWNELLIPHYTDGSGWGFENSGEISLKKFAGNLVKIKFQYNSSTKHYATWEIQNLKVVEGEANIESIAAITNATVGAEAAWSGTFKDAVVTYVSGGTAFIEDATGGTQLYMSGHTLKAGQVINGEVSGKAKLYNGYSELTALDVTKATVTEGTVPAPTVMTIAELKARYLRFQNCQVLLKGVTFDTALTASNRKGVISQGEDKIDAYSQVNGKVIMDGTGDLLCWPTRYNATLQVGCWLSEHFVK
ncbi:MAG: BACON domain-containing protein [Bacteroidales bacterium]|nr:BACON domain-containing protein [Bacteroidales bacterium]